jgi:hypothetical protein
MKFLEESIVVRWDIMASTDLSDWCFAMNCAVFSASIDLLYAPYTSDPWSYVI